MMGRCAHPKHVARKGKESPQAAMVKGVSFIVEDKLGEMRWFVLVGKHGEE
jgi:hypothetical protein